MSASSHREFAQKIIDACKFYWDIESQDDDPLIEQICRHASDPHHEFAQRVIDACKFREDLESQDDDSIIQQIRRTLRMYALQSVRDECENDHLKDENEKLKVENEFLKRQNARCKAECERLKEECGYEDGDEYHDALQGENETLKAEIEALKESKFAGVLLNLEDGVMVLRDGDVELKVEFEMPKEDRDDDNEKLKAENAKYKRRYEVVDDYMERSEQWAEFLEWVEEYHPNDEVAEFPTMDNDVLEQEFETLECRECHSKGWKLDSGAIQFGCDCC